ncbi:hypothetical protein PN398_10080 [Romboutsia sp. 1001216sp1]|uniref:hypothetical protein n=1 Tax=Clostridia TaxID=186801 RepID=UPI00232A9F5A|nr:hypothetical protein [Romboutsia sp. 1001216sp1]MDB8791075.1 hypothetical protein [Romboutsia sp. 1001216sp1]
MKDTNKYLSAPTSLIDLYYKGEYKVNQKDYERMNSSIYISNDDKIAVKLNNWYRTLSYTPELSLSNIKLKSFILDKTNKFTNLVSTFHKPILDFNKLNRVGIDRIKMYVELKAIDLEKCGKIARIDKPLIKENSTYYEIVDAETGEILSISNFIYVNKIENKYDHIAPMTTYGLKSDDKKCNLKFKLDITAPKVLYNSPTPYNIKLRDLPNLLDYVKKDLEEKGMYIDYSDGAVYYIELNKNIITHEPLSNKHNILSYISNNVFEGNAKLHSNTLFEKEESKTLTINCKRESISLYDKSAQLYNKFNLKLDKEFINIDKYRKIYRLELTLKNIEGVERFFKTTNINELKNKEDILHDRFHSYIDNKFIEKIKLNINDVYSELYNSIEYNKYKSVKNSYDKNKSNVLDIGIVGQAMFDRYKQNTNDKKNFRRDFIKLIKHCEEEAKFDSLKELEDLIKLITNKEIVLLNIQKNIKNHISNNQKKVV